MKKIISGIIILLLIGIVYGYPKLDNYVNDFAGLLSVEEETKLNEEIHNINLNYSVEIAIVTIQNTEGDGRVNYANRIGEENGVGKKGKDNGIVVLWSLDNEKGGAIATGRGIESILNDAKVTRIGRASREFFDQKQYYQAFEFILNEIKVELDKAQSQGDQLATESTNPDLNLNKTLISIVVLIFVIFIVGKIFTRRGGYSDDYKPTRSKSIGSGYKYVPIIIPPIKSSGSSGNSSYKSSSSDDDDDDYSGRSSSYVGNSYSGGGFSGFGGGSFGGAGGKF